MSFPPDSAAQLLLAGGSRFSLAQHVVSSPRYVAPHYLKLLMAYKHLSLPYNLPSLWLPRTLPWPLAFLPACTCACRGAILPQFACVPASLRRVCAPVLPSVDDELYATAPVDATSGYVNREIPPVIATRRPCTLSCSNYPPLDVCWSTFALLPHPHAAGAAVNSEATSVIDVTIVLPAPVPCRSCFWIALYSPSLSSFCST
ncbi:hypothetical protein FB451DRAFT_1565109 [Mycena latifolia]|nr:hypothetical protein FB451DRAFT_1565109 [Mycena latifolia]